MPNHPQNAKLKSVIHYNFEKNVMIYQQSPKCYDVPCPPYMYSIVEHTKHFLRYNIFAAVRVKMQSTLHTNNCRQDRTLVDNLVLLHFSNVGKYSLHYSVANWQNNSLSSSLKQFPSK